MQKKLLLVTNSLKPLKNTFFEILKVSPQKILPLLHDYNKKGLIYPGIVYEPIYLNEKINHQLQEIEKQYPLVQKTPLSKLDELLSTSTPKIYFTMEDLQNPPPKSFDTSLSFKIIDTLEEKLAFFNLRYNIYLDEGFITRDQLTIEQNDLQYEWDNVDDMSLEKLTLQPNLIYVGAFKDGKIIGGARIIKGICPMEQGIVMENYQDKFINVQKGETFTLEKYRQLGLPTTEVSRLIISKEARKNKWVLFNLFLLLDHCVKNENPEKDFIFCTTQKKQKLLYEFAGFLLAGPPITYSLRGTWYVLKRDRKQNREHPELFSKRNDALYSYITQEIPRVTEINMYREYLTNLNFERGAI